MTEKTVWKNKNINCRNLWSADHFRYSYGFLYPNITNIIADSKQQSALLQWDDLKMQPQEQFRSSSASSIVESSTDNTNDTFTGTTSDTLNSDGHQFKQYRNGFRQSNARSG